MYTQDDKIKINSQVQEHLDTLDDEQLYFLTASELHQIWRETRLIKDENGNNILDKNGNIQYEDRWKELDPTKNPEDANYVKMFLSKKLKPNNKVKVENDKVSINISQMSFKELAPSWQKENIEAAIVAVNFALDNYIYLKDEKFNKMAVQMLGSAIHALWLSRPSNAYARKTELGKRYGLLPQDEQIKDNRHIIIATKLIDYMVKEKNMSHILDTINKINTSNKR